MSSPEFELDRKEMGLSRHPAELAAWVEYNCERMGEFKESKSYARSGSALPKKFFEEVRPLSIYAVEKYGLEEEVSVQPNLGSENFDGVIRFADAHPIFVEMTSAKDGYAESLRIESLEANGHVNALGRVEVTGKRNSPDRRIDVCDEAVDHNELVGEHLAIVTNRYLAKADARYTRNHVLLIIVDDHIPFRELRDANLLEGLIKTLIKLYPPSFGAIATIGQSGRVLFEIPVEQSETENAL